MDTRLTLAVLTLVSGLPGCAPPAPRGIGDGPVVVTTATSPTLAGGRAWFTADALIVELRISDTACAAEHPDPGDVFVSITVPRALAIPGELPVTSDFLRSDDVDVGVTEVGAGLSSQNWLLSHGTLRLDAIDGATVRGGLVAWGRADFPDVDGTFAVPACPGP